MKTKVCDAAAAAQRISDRQTVASTGVLAWMTPDSVLRALGERFLAEGSPRDLTFLFTVGTGDSLSIPGMDHVAKPGLMKRIVAGSYINPQNPQTGLRPALMRIIQADQVEAYAWPIGATMHWLREVARRGPGYLTKIGLGTYADPRQQGAKLTASTKDNLVEVVQFRGEEYLFYPSWPIDVGIIRASSSDEVGNLSFEDEPFVSSALAIALAVKASGGTVIAQVKRVVPRGSRPAHDVRVPGALIDHVVVDEDAPMGTDISFDPSYLQPTPDVLSRVPRLPDGPDKVIARRVAMEVRPEEVTIFGFGASSDAVLAMAENGQLDDGRLLDHWFTTEHGPFGGIVMSGWQFSANMSPEAILDGPSQFDFIDGGGCTLAALAFAQFDADGRVNVSKFGAANPGAGGFIDIAHNAQRIVLAGTFSTGGLIATPRDGRLVIEREGAVAKFVQTVDQITYSLADGVRTGQQAILITERAVFEMTATGLRVIEVAEGVDLQRDVLDKIPFDVQVSSDLCAMDRHLFTS